MKMGSLFSGIGGFDLGFERAGMRVAWQAECDARALRVLELQWPDVRRYEDVRETGRGCEPVDVVCGGFPCQDVSVAGRRAGLAGERSGLWFEFHRVLEELRPGWVVVENVPGLLSSNRGRDFATVLRGLVQLGYSVVWRVLDAQYFGVPQRRRRVFIVGHLGDGRAADVLFEREGLPWDTPPRRETGEDIAGCLESRTGGGGFPGTDGAIANHVVAACLQEPDAKGPDSDTKPGHLVVVTPYDMAQITSKANRSNPQPGDPCAPLKAGFDVSAVAFETRIARNGRGAPQSVCPPLKAESGKTGCGDSAPCVIYHGIRRLMPVECERLQGFPDGWTDSLSDSGRYRTLGNAVAVPVAEWIARRILAVEETL